MGNLSVLNFHTRSYTLSTYFSKYVLLNNRPTFVRAIKQGAKLVQNTTVLRLYVLLNRVQS